VLARWNGRPLGSIGDLAALSFHETKNVSAGEGGALLVNSDRFLARAEIVWEKGTDRSRFYRGEVDKYSWRDLGSSYQPSEISAAFLWAQLEEADRITRARLSVWDSYHRAFEELEREGLVRRPVVPRGCDHNAHLYYLLLPNGRSRAALLAALAAQGVNAIFHYVPLHGSPAGQRFGRIAGSMRETESTSERLIRLPLWSDMTAEVAEQVIHQVRQLQRVDAIP